MTATPAEPETDRVAQPVERVSREGVEYALLGTAHVSRESEREVREMIASGDYDCVAVELCPSRHRMLTEQHAWRELDLFHVIRQGKAGLLVTNLVLSGYQKRLADQLGIEPGAEMRAGIEMASQAGLPLQLVDRDVTITLKRAWRKQTLWQRFMLFNALLASVFTREEISEADIERLKQGDLLESAFAEFAEQSPGLYAGLIAERDRYMAARLRAENADHRGKRVLAVLGAGHLQGVAEHLGKDQADPDETIEQLGRMPPPARWPKLLPWAVLLLVSAGFVAGFLRNPELGWSLVATWVVINGVLAALGAALARAHPLTVLSGVAAAPITSLNPTVGAGMVTAAVEAWLRKPTVADFECLRDDVASWRGWWHNRVARVLLVFMLSNFGSAAGTWIAGVSMVRQLFG